MEFDLDKRSARLSVGELAAFVLGPSRAAAENVGGGLWRARVGMEWHAELRRQLVAGGARAEFEVAVEGRIFHGGWVIELGGRVDQVILDFGMGSLDSGDGAEAGRGRRVFREVKTVGDKLPLEEDVLRRNYPGYFAQLAAYLELARLGTGTEGAAAPSAGWKPALPGEVIGELLFVEAGSGVCQAVRLADSDFGFLRAQLERVVAFLNQRAEARERLRGLVFSPAFEVLREGQEGTREELSAACRRGGAVLFSAPTGFGKTGVLLESALGLLREGRFERVIYLTGKATGQVQVAETLRKMGDGRWESGDGDGGGEPSVLCGRASSSDAPALAAAPSLPLRGVGVWQVRPKREHCVNGEFVCRREACGFLEDLEERWKQGALGRFCFFENRAREIGEVREAGRAAGVCPYEITREVLAFRDFWLGDFNYVFSPASCRLFLEQPGFSARETLLLVDEAHNLPSRVADVFSHEFSAERARAVSDALGFAGEFRKLGRAWDVFARLLGGLKRCEALGLADEEDLADVVRELAEAVEVAPPDWDKLPPEVCEWIWELPAFADWLGDGRFSRLLWCPRDGVLRGDCLDAAALCGERLREFGAVVFSTATAGPPEVFAESTGVEKIEVVRAWTPWRAGAYDVAYDARVDTRFSERGKFLDVTAESVAVLCGVSRGAAAVFFPSYAYAESVAERVGNLHPELRVMLQPRGMDLDGQVAWVAEALQFSDAVFLVLGSRFSEGIDALGGRVSHAMVVGPALPEVNAVQRARMEASAGLGKAAAFERVYQIPGLQKVNQALGRLVRAPGQRAKVLLHCRRFLEPSFARLLDEDFQFGETIEDREGLECWAGAEEKAES